MKLDVHGEASGMAIDGAVNKLVGAIAAAAAAAAATAADDAANDADAKLCDACGYTELVLGNGERRACCNCDDLLDNLTIFLVGKNINRIFIIYYYHYQGQ